jgi:thiamine-phosphate pyrophosphorylase
MTPRETSSGLVLPSLYAIIDYSFFVARQEPVSAVARYARELLDAGAALIQFRDKSQPAMPRRFLGCVRELRRITAGQATLIVNDRVDLCLAAGADGVHLGQDDLSPAAARKIFDQTRDGLARFIGISTHTITQVREADALPVDYIALGPIFATSSKINPDPVIGLEILRQARRITAKPLVAIGGITRQNCLQVKNAGGDAVAVISDLFESPGKAVADFLRVLG